MPFKVSVRCRFPVRQSSEHDNNLRSIPVSANDLPGHLPLQLLPLPSLLRLHEAQGKRDANGPLLDFLDSDSSLHNPGRHFLCPQGKKNQPQCFRVKDGEPGVLPRTQLLRQPRPLAFPQQLLPLLCAHVPPHSRRRHFRLEPVRYSSLVRRGKSL